MKVIFIIIGVVLVYLFVWSMKAHRWGVWLEDEEMKPVRPINWNEMTEQERWDWLKARNGIR